MAAPIGNKFWQLRNKHGRDALFQDPDKLWEAACEYFEHVDDNPWQKTDVVKGGESAGMLLTIPTARPYTLTGLCLYLECGKNYWDQFKKNAKEDFSGVISRIEEVIYTQKFEGAAVGAFNPSIIARELGLAEKQDITSNGESITQHKVIFEDNSKK